MSVKMILVIVLPLLLQLLGLTFAILNDSYISSRHRNLLLLITAIALSLILQNYLDVELANQPSAWLARTLVAVYGYSIRPVVIVLFIRIVELERIQWPFWVIVAVNAFFYSTAFYSDICIHYTETNHFQRGPLGFSAHIVGAGLLIWLLILSILKYRHRNMTEAILPIGSAAFIILAAIGDTFYQTDEDVIVSFLTITMISCCIFFYIWLHLQFVREHEQALKAEQRIRIMISQIQPHFLYNTLSTIQALCKTDPEKAFEITGKFGTYLRQNINSLQQDSLIPIREELNHTMIYAEIEQIRFPSIEIEYDIKDEDFLIPPLTIQPLVENAIRHGVRIREEGRIKVKTRKGKYYHRITIWDNGKGFDVRSMETMGEDHIGIRNVKERIENLCSGSMAINSQVGEGTIITMFIPVREEKP